jgi:catechol 2,3-dioxygenase-like lactoylglutathione lyase family enzyme
VSLPARVNLITLGVADVARAAAFYERLGWRRSTESPDSVAFFDLGAVVLSVWSRDELAADAHQTAGTARDPGAMALAINVATRGEVDDALATAVGAGATVLKPADDTEWGGYTAYFADPDGHAWELAWNPGFPLDDQGHVQLP